MDTKLKRLLDAAREINRLRCKQRDRTKAWSQLATDSRSGTVDRKEIERRKQLLDVTNVVDFSTAVDELCSALMTYERSHPNMLL